MSTQVIPISDVGYWSQYYKVFGSAADVYSIVSVQDGESPHYARMTHAPHVVLTLVRRLVRQALGTQPVNLANLIITLSHHVFTLLPSPLFPSSSKASEQEPTKEALNCLRVLGRILVVIYEADAEMRDPAGSVEEETFAMKYLWSRTPLDSSQQGQTRMEENERVERVQEDGQFTIEGSDSEEDEEETEQVDAGARAFKAIIGNPPAVKAESPTGTADDPLSQAPLSREQEEEEENTLPCLVDRLFSCTVDLLFCAGFTVPESVRGQDKVGEKINVSRRQEMVVDD